MSTYDEQIAAFAKFGMDAIEQLPKIYFELFLSLKEQDAIEKIVSFTRLYASELPTPTTTEEMYKILERALGDLLAADKIKVSEYGLSDAGKAQYNYLVNLSAPVEAAPVAPAVTDPKDELRDVIDAFNGPTITFNAKMKDTKFRQRFDQAVALNLV
jgi:hypothetical protein